MERVFDNPVTSRGKSREDRDSDIYGLYNILTSFPDDFLDLPCNLLGKNLDSIPLLNAFERIFRTSAELRNGGNPKKEDNKNVAQEEEMAEANQGRQGVGRGGRIPAAKPEDWSKRLESQSITLRDMITAIELTRTDIGKQNRATNHDLAKVGNAINRSIFTQTQFENFARDTIRQQQTTIDKMVHVMNKQWPGQLDGADPNAPMEESEAEILGGTKLLPKLKLLTKKSFHPYTFWYSNDQDLERVFPGTEHNETTKEAKIAAAISQDMLKLIKERNDTF